MKWAKEAGIALAVLITIVIGTLILVSQNLDNRVARAHQRGSEEGYAQGYVVGYEEGREEGYSSGYNAGFGEGMGASYLVRNSTYDEVQQILAEGGTGSVWQINNYFEDRGIRAGYVRVRLAAWYPPYYRIGSKAGAGGTVFTPPLTRADWTPYRYWVAFETVDKGLIFIQPWSGKEVKLETGQRYSELTGFPPPHYDDTIVEIIIVW